MIKDKIFIDKKKQILKHVQRKYCNSFEITNYKKTTRVDFSYIA